jgi:HK97 gp10 family phage protein
VIKVNAQRTKYGNVKTAVANGKEISNLMIGAAIASQAKLLAPVDYGQLRNSLSASNTSRTEMLNNMEGEKAEALDTQGLKDDEVYAGSNSDHAIFQEYGTVKQPAQPYLRPAMEAVVQRKTPAEIFEKYGREAMDRELKGRK